MGIWCLIHTLSCSVVAHAKMPDGSVKTQKSGIRMCKPDYRLLNQLLIILNYDNVEVVPISSVIIKSLFIMYV